jgi:hypothetical protein
VDTALLSELLPSIALGIALAACAGLRAWLPLLLAGLLARAGALQLGSGFQFLASNRALVLFGLATTLEMLADKVPALDHALDALSTLLRPAAGALLAASVLAPVSDPLTALALGVAVGAPAALVPHAAKTALRAASTGLTAGLGNPVLSLIEDAVALALFALAVLVPLLVALSTLVVAAFVLRWLLRRVRPVASHA